MVSPPEDDKRKFKNPLFEHSEDNMPDSKAEETYKREIGWDLIHEKNRDDTQNNR